MKILKWMIVWIALTIVIALVLQLIMGCGTDIMYPSDVRGGTMCQGSKAWKANNICNAGVNSGLCIKAVSGPITLTELRSSELCPHVMIAGIKDTWSIPEDNDKPRWEMRSAPNVPLHIKNSTIEVRAGESLFVGTLGHNLEVDSTCCYITWSEK